MIALHKWVINDVYCSAVDGPQNQQSKATDLKMTKSKATGSEDPMNCKPFGMTVNIVAVAIWFILCCVYMQSIIFL